MISVADSELIIKGNENNNINAIAANFDRADGVDESLITEFVEIDEIGFNTRTILCFCVFLFFLDININLDHGALPVAAVEIKEQLDLPNASIGTLGSMVFLGLVTGSFTASIVMGKFRYKTILTSAFVGNALGFFGFILTNNFYLMGFGRLVSGFCQIFLTIYIPVYVDCFGTAKLKPFMMSLILLAAPLGVVFGYGGTGWIIGSGLGWRAAFATLGMISLVSALLLFFVPERYLDIENCIAMKR